MNKIPYWLAKVVYVICIVIIILYIVAKLSGSLSLEGAFTTSGFTVGTDILTNIMPLEYAYRLDFSNPSYPTVFVFLCVIPTLLICRSLLWRLPQPGHSSKQIPPEPNTEKSGIIGAIKSGNIARARSLLESDPTFVNVSAPFSALHYAAYMGDAEMAGLLLSKGADVRVADKAKGWTPLHYASFYNHKAVVELLLASGADIEAEDRQGKSALDLAKDREIAQLLRDHV